jgi:asparagine synthase (glutamine-hydrolysing)
MLVELAHRGPDDEGFATFAAGRCALGHRRLAIIDLTPTGHQPMALDDGRVAITFNGEIYNYRELRAELQALGHTFTSTGDTEVILRGYVQWGDDIIPRLNGMFAFALVDARGAEPTLLLARDRFGQKPLYYTETDGAFAFASEMKALLTSPGVSKRISLRALDAYLTYLWVPEPDTILEAVRKLPAAHWMRVTRDAVDLRCYWTLDLAPRKEGRSEREIARELTAKVEAAVDRTRVADVPVAAFLSGGLDSTAIVALMTRSGHAPIRVFSVGFREDEAAYEGFPDDLRYARLVAQRLGVQQEEIVLDARMTEQLPKLVWHLDEPMADPSILPLYAMSIAARKHTKVLLSGMGADEIFGGYRRHASHRAIRMWRALPRAARRRVLRPLAERLPSAGRGRLAPTFRRVKRLVRGLEDGSARPGAALAAWTTRAERRGLYASSAIAAAASAGEPAPGTPGDALDDMLRFDALVYLPSHNLNFTDKIGMAASVEIRAPFLDNELVEYAAALPRRAKVHGRRTKVALRDAMRGVVPDEVLARGKTGLGAPIRAWLVGPMKPLVDKVLSPERVEARGLFDPRAVAALREALESGRDDTSYQIWSLLVLELWMDAYAAEVPK